MNHRHCILVVDPDVQFQRELGREWAADYRLYHADGAESALPLMYRVHPDLILLALSPAIDETRETLQRIRTLTDNPVIVLVRAASCANAELSAEVEANACVEKDIPLAQLKLRVQSLLAPSAPAAPVKRKEPAHIPLRCLTVSQLMQIDRALNEIGAFGEIRLVKAHGRLRILVQVVRARLHPVPALGGE